MAHVHAIRALVWISRHARRNSVARRKMGLMPHPHGTQRQDIFHQASPVRGGDASFKFVLQRELSNGIQRRQRRMGSI